GTPDGSCIFSWAGVFAHSLSGEDVIPTFVAPAQAGVHASARSGAPLFAWIPAYAGTTTYLSLATFKAPGFFASLRVNLASVIFPRTVVGFRRDDQGAERRQNQRNAILIFVAPAQPGVQAFARRSAPFLRLDPGLRRDDNSLSLAGFNARLFAILRANRCAAIVPGQSWVFPRLANKTQLTTRPETREH